MSDATHTVRMAKGSLIVRFEMTEGSDKVAYFNGYTRREISRKSALEKMNRKGFRFIK